MFCVHVCSSLMRIRMREICASSMVKRHCCEFIWSSAINEYKAWIKVINALFHIHNVSNMRLEWRRCLFHDVIICYYYWLFVTTSDVPFLRFFYFKCQRFYIKGRLRARSVGRFNRKCRSNWLYKRYTMYSAFIKLTAVQVPLLHPFLQLNRKSLFIFP